MTFAISLSNVNLLFMMMRMLTKAILVCMRMKMIVIFAWTKKENRNDHHNHDGEFCGWPQNQKLMIIIKGMFIIIVLNNTIIMITMRMTSDSGRGS